MKKKILIVRPVRYDLRELASHRFASNYSIQFYEYDSSYESIVCKGFGVLTDDFEPQVVIEEIIKRCQEDNIDAVVSTEDYPGSILAIIAAQKLGLPAPDIDKILACQHKYYARCAQKQYVPEATPRFVLVNDHTVKDIASKLSFPLILKPIKASFSILANQVNSQKQLYSFVQQASLPKKFLDQFNWFVRHYSSCEPVEGQLLAEELLHGVQVTLEGFVYQGNVEIIGIVDSIMFPGTISFKRFEYPSSLPVTVQERMAIITRTFINGIGLDNTLFDIEFMYNSNTDTIAIIEINPRISPQLADLFEKVDGFNTYEALLALALGKKPTVSKKKGQFSIAGCFVFRIFEDQQVIKIPLKKQLEEVYYRFPEARVYVLARQGYRLSDEIQDGKSFRYGLVHLGAGDRQELFKKFEISKKLLEFQFKPVTNKE